MSPGNFSANTFQKVSARLSIGLPRLASNSEAPFSRRTPSFLVLVLRGWKGPDSSFAEAHKEIRSEPIHIEDEVKDQEDEVEDGRDK